MPEYGRLFGTTPHDEVRFAQLAPMPARSDWSVVALIAPSSVHSTGTIVTSGGPNSPAFGLQLRDGNLAIEADGVVRVSSLAPPEKRWTIAGASISAQGARMYVGASEGVRHEDCAPAPTGIAHSGSITIGWQPTPFAGGIASVFLFSAMIDDALMRRMCAAQADPFVGPKLIFGWVAPLDIDLVSRRAPLTHGTKVVSVSFQGFGGLIEPTPPRVAEPIAKLPAAPRAQPALPEYEPDVAPHSVDERVPPPSSRSGLFERLGLLGDEEKQE